MRVSSYVIAADLPDPEYSLLVHGYVGAVDKVRRPVGAALLDSRGGDAAAVERLLRDGERSRLVERGYLTDLSDDEERALLVSIAVELHTSDLTNTPAGFMFVPAYTCNLRCPYCFQPHDYHRGKGDYGTILSRELVDAAFAAGSTLGAPGALARHVGLLPASNDGEPGRPGSKIGLFGGEPLAEATRDIVGYIVAQAAVREMTVLAITNGVELDRFVDLLGPGLLSEVQITLDGTSTTHDRRRVGPGFRETFDRICDNIDLALATGVRVSLRMNVDSVNAASLESLADHCVERGWSTNPLFNAHAAAVSSEVPDPKLIDRTQLVEHTMALQRSGGVFSSYEKAARETLENCLFTDGYAFKGVANCSAESGLLMFDPLGDVYACWEEIGDADFRVGTYGPEGVVFEGDTMARWLSRFPGAIDECARCPYALIHVSGCAKHAANDTGSIYASACESFKQYFPRTVAQAFDELEAEVFDRPTRFAARPLAMSVESPVTIGMKPLTP